MTSPVPFFFGGDAHLFGWHHGPTGSLRRSCGVVLCPPIGHEYVCAHRAFRHLAEQLAAQGFDVLRFDYSGTGDSAGTPEDADLVRAWHESIALAADVLRERSGVRELSFVGLRMGAAFAATVAAERSDVSSVVLWDSVATGKAYVRQVMMLGRTGVDATRISADGTIEAAGFSISDTTASALNGLRWSNLSARSAPRGFVLSRDDIPGDGAVTEQLRRCGTVVDEAVYPGYASFMTSPVKSTLPTMALHRITEWLSATHPAEESAESAAGITGSESQPSYAEYPADLAYPLRVTQGDGAAFITEQPVRFGENLFGILVRPEQARAGKPIVVTLNTGADHHIGPHRLYVSLARTWAAQGFAVLRFDIAGLGDSAARPGASEGIAYPDSALDDVRAAVRYAMHAYGTTRVILVGMCSGGYYSIHAAHAGVPVTGLIAVNPPLYWQPGMTLDDDPYTNAIRSAQLGRSLLSPEKWVRLVRGDVDIGNALGAIMRRVPSVTSKIWSVVSSGSTKTNADGRAQKKQEAESLADLFPGTVNTRLIFSIDDPALFYFDEQVPMTASIRKRAAFGIHIADDADHTFMPIRQQKRLKELLTQRLMEV